MIQFTKYLEPVFYGDVVTDSAVKEFYFVKFGTFEGDVFGGRGIKPYIGKMYRIKQRCVTDIGHGFYKREIANYKIRKIYDTTGILWG